MTRTIPTPCLTHNAIGGTHTGCIGYWINGCSALVLFCVYWASRGLGRWEPRSWPLTPFIGGIGLDQPKPLPQAASPTSSPSRWIVVKPPCDGGDGNLSELDCRHMLITTPWSGGRYHRRFFLPALPLDTGIRSAWRALMWSKSLVRDVKVSWQTAHLCWDFQASGESRRFGCTHWRILEETYGT